MSVLGANFRRDMEIRRYPLLVYTLVPLTALVLQAWLPRVLGPLCMVRFAAGGDCLLCAGPPQPDSGHI